MTTAGVINDDDEGEAATGEADTCTIAQDVCTTRRGPLLAAGIIAGVVVAVLAAMAGWNGYQAYQVRQSERSEQRFLDGARQGALNLANIDWNHVQADAQRIADSSTGPFLADFQQRLPQFTAFVQKAQSTSVATIGQAGLESSDGDHAQAIIAMSVNVTSGTAASDPQPRSWRIRVGVQRMPDGTVKMSSVEFVP